MFGHSHAWKIYSYVSFGAAFVLMLGGIWLLPVEVWIKGYFMMGTVFLTGTAVSLTKTLRDIHEADKLNNRIDEARTEKILREYDQAA